VIEGLQTGEMQIQPTLPPPVPHGMIDYGVNERGEQVVGLTKSVAQEAPRKPAPAGTFDAGVNERGEQVVGMFNRAPSAPQNPVAVNYKDANTKAALEGLAQKGLLNDPDAWRTYRDENGQPLSAREKHILGNLRGQRMLKPGNDAMIAELLGKSIAPPGSRGDGAPPAGGPPAGTPPDQPPYGAMASDGGQTYPFAELLAAILAGGAASGAIMRALAPYIEIIPFYSRLNPDVSCYALEKRILQDAAPSVAAVGGLGGPAAEMVGKPVGPGGGGAGGAAVAAAGAGAAPTGGAPGSAQPDREKENKDRYDRLINIDPAAVNADPSVRDRYKDIIDGYRETGKIDERELNDIERAAGVAGDRKRQDWDRGTQAALDGSNKLIHERGAQHDAAFERKKELADQMAGIRERMTTGTSASAAGADLVNDADVYKRNPDGSIDYGSIDEEKFKDFRKDASDLFKDQRDAAQRDKQVWDTISNRADNAAWVAEKTRNYSFAAGGAVLSGGVGAAAGGGIFGWWAGTATGIVYGAGTGAIRAASDAGSLDMDVMGRGAAQGVIGGAIGGLVGGVIGSAAAGVGQAAGAIGGTAASTTTAISNFIGNNPTVTGAVFGAIGAKATGGDVWDGMIEGAIGGKFADIGGRAWASGGVKGKVEWNRAPEPDAPLWRQDFGPDDVQHGMPETTPRRPGGSGESKGPRVGVDTPEDKPWLAPPERGGAPSRPATSSQRPQDVDDGAGAFNSNRRRVDTDASGPDSPGANRPAREMGDQPGADLPETGPTGKRPLKGMGEQAGPATDPTTGRVDLDKLSDDQLRVMERNLRASNPDAADQIADRLGQRGGSPRVSSPPTGDPNDIPVKDIFPDSPPASQKPLIDRKVGGAGKTIDELLAEDAAERAAAKPRKFPNQDAAPDDFSTKTLKGTEPEGPPASPKARAPQANDPNDVAIKDAVPESTPTAKKPITDRKVGGAGKTIDELLAEDAAERAAAKPRKFPNQDAAPEDFSTKTLKGTEPEGPPASPRARAPQANDPNDIPVKDAVPESTPTAKKPIADRKVGGAGKTLDELLAEDAAERGAKLPPRTAAQGDPNDVPIKEIFPDSPTTAKPGPTPGRVTPRADAPDAPAVTRADTPDTPATGTTPRGTSDIGKPPTRRLPDGTEVLDIPPDNRPLVERTMVGGQPPASPGVRRPVPGDPNDVPIEDVFGKSGSTPRATTPPRPDVQDAPVVPRADAPVDPAPTAGSGRAKPFDGEPPPDADQPWSKRWGKDPVTGEPIDRGVPGQAPDAPTSAAGKGNKPDPFGIVDPPPDADQPWSKRWGKDPVTGEPIDLVKGAKDAPRVGVNRPSEDWIAPPERGGGQKPPNPFGGDEQIAPPPDDQQPWRTRFPKDPESAGGKDFYRDEQGRPVDMGPPEGTERKPWTPPSDAPPDFEQPWWNKQPDNGGVTPNVKAPPEVNPDDLPWNKGLKGDERLPRDYEGPGYKPAEYPGGTGEPNLPGERSPVLKPREDSIQREQRIKDLSELPPEDLNRRMEDAEIHGGKKEAAIHEEAMRRQRGEKGAPTPVGPDDHLERQAAVDKLKDTPREELRDRAISERLSGRDKQAEIYDEALNRDKSPDIPRKMPSRDADVEQLSNLDKGDLEALRDARRASGDEKGAKLFDDALERQSQKPPAAPPASEPARVETPDAPATRDVPDAPVTPDAPDAPPASRASSAGADADVVTPDTPRGGAPKVENLQTLDDKINQLRHDLEDPKAANHADLQEQLQDLELKKQQTTERLRQVNDYLRENPAERGDHYINMGQKRLGDAMRTGHLQPGEYGVVAATHSGQGPGNYVFENTQVVRVKQGDVIYGTRLDNGKLFDANGKQLPLEPGKVIMVGGPGAEHQVAFVKPDGKIGSAIPASKLERWAPSENKFVPVDPNVRPAAPVAPVAPRVTDAADPLGAAPGQQPAARPAAARPQAPPAEYEPPPPPPARTPRGDGGPAVENPQTIDDRIGNVKRDIDKIGTRIDEDYYGKPRAGGDRTVAPAPDEARGLEDQIRQRENALADLENRKAAAAAPAAGGADTFEGAKTGDFEVPNTNRSTANEFDGVDTENLKGMREFADGDARKAIDQELAKRGAAPPKPPPAAPLHPDSPPDLDVSEKLGQPRTGAPRNDQPSATDAPPAPRGIQPDDMPSGDNPLTRSGVEDLAKKYSNDDLLAARDQAYAEGRRADAVQLDRALEYNDYREPIDPVDFTPNPAGDLPDFAQIERLSNKYSYKQLLELRAEAWSRPDEESKKLALMLTNAIDMKGKP
jgi:hypothetical protein